MKKHLFILFISFWYFNSSFSQTQTLIKSTEYLRGEEKRRDIYLNADMQIVKEDYYGEKTWSYKYNNYIQTIIFSIEYISTQKIGKVSGYDEKGRVFEINYINGTYKDFQKDISLKFKDDFIFDGIQKGEKIVVNYKNGIKEGKVLQADSASIGTKVVAVQKVDPRYLRFNILKSYTAINDEDVYSIFNGVLLNFKNGQLNGEQKSFYLDGRTKFKGNFVNGRLIAYASYNKENSIISKLETDSGFTNKPQILNGQLLSTDNQYIFWHHSLEEVGDIIRVNEDFDPQSYTKYGNFVREIVPTFFETKKAFDNGKVEVMNEREMRAIFGIPMFHIQRFDFNNKEDEAIVKIGFSNTDGKIKDLNQYRETALQLADNHYLTRSPCAFYEYTNGKYPTYLLLPHNGLDDIYIRHEKEEKRVFELNQKLVTWLTSSYNYYPSNLYIRHGGYEGDEYYINDGKLEGFLNNFITKLYKNILELENKTFLFKDPFDNDTEFYKYRDLVIKKYISHIVIPKLNSEDKIILYDKHKVDVLVNSKQYCFVFDKNNTGKFKVSEVKVLDVSNGTLIYEYRM